MDKREIIQKKSLYKGKHEKWNLLDEIQFRFILKRCKKEPIQIFKAILRPNVVKRLEVHGKTVNYYTIPQTGETWCQVSE